MENTKFLDKIKQCSTYTDVISNSLNKTTELNSFIFRKNNYWYRFENWNLPNSGVIREWRAENTDFIPKKDYISSFVPKNSNVLFSLEKYQSLVPTYNIRHVLLSNDCNIFALIIEKKGQFDLAIFHRNCFKISDLIENISLESVPSFIGRNLLFCREDTKGRPNQLFYRNVERREEQLLYNETDISRRLKIHPLGQTNESCFISSNNFKNKKGFLYIFSGNNLEKYSFSQGIPDHYDIIEIETEIYFSYLNKSNNSIKIINLESGYLFEIKIESKREYCKLVGIGSNILLCNSNIFDNFFLLIKLSKKDEISWKEMEIIVPPKTELYQNSFSTENIFFLEKSILSETLYSFDIKQEKIKKEFTKSYFEIPEDSRYHYKLISTSAKEKKPQIPISLLWKGRSEENLPYKKKCITFVYGAYGRNDQIEFDPIILSIVEAGFVYAVIHVRGGGFLGSEWHKNGKGLFKKNSIDDYICGVDYLIDNNIVNERKIGLITSSAGGIIAGAVLNEKSNLLKGMLLFSPFINPYKTLIDGSDPLSKTEIPEWGDITDIKIRKYIKSYSPFQNITKAKGSKTEVINILGYYDNYISNKDVFEWSERLRSLNINSSVYLNPEAGHGGFEAEDSKLLIKTLNYFFEQVSFDSETQ